MFISLYTHVFHTIPATKTQPEPLKHVNVKHKNHCYEIIFVFTTISFVCELSLQKIFSHLM